MREVSITAEPPRLAALYHWLQRNALAGAAPMPQDLQAIFSHFIDKRQKATGGLLLTAAEGRAVQAIPALAGRPAPVSRARPKLREILAVCLRDCPSLHAGLAIRRRDTTTRPSHRSSGRERRGLPIQCRGRPTLQADPTNHNNRSAPNAREPNAPPTGRKGGGSGASRRSGHWALQ